MVNIMGKGLTFFLSVMFMKANEKITPETPLLAGGFREDFGRMVYLLIHD